MPYPSEPGQSLEPIALFVLGEVRVARQTMRAKSVGVSIRKSLDGRCFVCELVAGNPDFAHHVIYEDDRFIAFLNRYPILYGYVLVAPREHREQVTGDFSVDGYQAMQALVFRVAEAVRRTVPTERITY
jgi:ATP adenylyltransferase